MLNRNRRILITAISVLLIAVGVALACGRYLFERSDHPSSSKLSLESSASKVAIVNLKGVIFVIPKRYLGSPFGVDKFGFWMLVPLPVSDGDARESGERLSGGRQYVPRLRVNLDAKWPGAKALGMHYSIPKSARGPFSPPEPGPFGLTIERALAKKGQPAQWTTDDLYTYGKITSPEEFFSFHCQSEIATEGRKTGPISAETGLCEMGFLYKDFLVEAGFPKSRLAEWRYFHTYVTRMLDCMSGTRLCGANFGAGDKK